MFAGRKRAGSVNGDAPTWHADIAPLVSEHCQSCHSDGGIAPFGLGTYAQAKMWAGTFEGVLPSGFMPPFLAATTPDCQPRFGFGGQIAYRRRDADHVLHLAVALEDGVASRVEAGGRPRAMVARKRAHVDVVAHQEAVEADPFADDVVDHDW